ncbi:hypothetical protein TSUD_244750 [Trifolium subterraneum]|uniref:Membrane protein of ER body-like protein n=1 Tax=Trifolium subterraneum TaxID=3900 RepID=A0A1B5Z7E0_TRISU|nr:hypothetical protein TSUD_244750 [Trifolium subterraneum]
MEQENQHQLMIVHDNIHEEMDDDFALKTNDNINNNLVTDVVVTSSSSSVSMSNGGSSHHSNGRTSTIVTDPDESSFQKEEEDEEIRNVGECNSDFGDDKEEDCVPVGLGLVAEFLGQEEVTNGEVIIDATFDSESSDILQNKYNVYFDKQQGVWKCHHCTWSTKRFDSPSTVSNWNLKGYREMLMNVNTLIQHGPCFVWETKGTEVNGLNRVQNGDATNHEKSKFDEQVENSAIQNGLSSKVDNQQMRIVNDKVPSSSEQSASHNSLNKQVTTLAANICEETKKESDLKNEIDQQEKEFDVELVIAKQETHDLYCPNCKSCITKRVILKKRKRNIHVLDKKGKRDRLDPVFDDNVANSVDDNLANSTTTHEVNQGDDATVISEITSLEPPVVAAADDDNDNDDHPEKEVEVFRCLSCFSIFIPSGKGFNLFRNFGGASKQEISQNPSTGDTFREPSRIGPADLQQSTITSTIPSSPDNGYPEGILADAAPTNNAKPISDVNNGHGRMNSPISSNGVQSVVQDFIDFSEKEQSLTRKPRANNGEENKTSVDTIKTNTVEVTSSMNYSNGTVSEYKSVNSVTTTSSETFVSSRETTKGAIPKHYQERPELLVPISATVGSLIVENSPNDVKKPLEFFKNSTNDVNKTLEFFKNNDSSLRQGGVPSAFDSTSSAIDAMFPSKMRKGIDENINPSVGKENNDEVIVDVDREGNESTTLQTEDNVPVDGVIVTDSQTQVGIGAQPRDEIGEPKKWEIVKSIVYGGLVESITSLGIVSSAASSGATPLNIIALGFANLIGGLFILGHNLKELKDNHSRGQQLQTNVQDRYQEQLGSRSNFVFHAVIAVLSFLIFGSVPLIIYGVLINKNYYDDVKVAIVAATSVACIILLTIGKVYTARPPKSYIKTVLYYVIMALAASGISYIAGKLIKDLLDKFSHSESGFAITMPISDTSMETTWMSY